MLWSEAFTVSDTALANLKGTRLAVAIFGNLFGSVTNLTKQTTLTFNTAERTPAFPTVTSSKTPLQSGFYLFLVFLLNCWHIQITSSQTCKEHDQQ